jgi:hypothetical protein
MIQVRCKADWRPTMRLLLIFIATTLLALSYGHAGQKTKPAKPNPGLKYGTYLISIPPALHKALGLTKKQDSQMKSINAKYDAKMKDAFSGGPGKPHDMEGMRPIFMGRWNALYAVLTESQKATLKQWALKHPVK